MGFAFVRQPGTFVARRVVLCLRSLHSPKGEKLSVTVTARGKTSVVMFTLDQSNSWRGGSQNLEP